MAQEQTTGHKTFLELNEFRNVLDGKAERLRVGGAEVDRLNRRPGRKWSLHVKRIAETGSCKAPDF